MKPRLFDLSSTWQLPASPENLAPREIEFDAGGHLQGTGRVTLVPQEQGKTTRMEIEWRVRPTQRSMNVLTPVAAPVFVSAHSLMMRQGEKGLEQALADKRTRKAA